MDESWRRSTQRRDGSAGRRGVLPNDEMTQRNAEMSWNVADISWSVAEMSWSVAEGS